MRRDRAGSRGATRGRRLEIPPSRGQSLLGSARSSPAPAEFAPECVERVAEDPSCRPLEPRSVNKMRRAHLRYPHSEMRHALHVRIEVRDVDELGAALVGRLSGRTRLLLEADLVPDQNDLAFLHVRAMDGELGE